MAEAINNEVIQEHIASRGLTVEDLKQQCCTEDVLLKLSKDLYNWEVVGLYLNLTKSEIKGIKVDYSSEEERRIHTLTKWKEKNGDDATYYNLVDALIDGKRVDIVDTALDCLKAIMEQIAKQKADEGVDSDTLQEEDIQLLCGCGKCTLDEFLRSGCPNPGAQQQFPLLDVTKLTTHTLVARLLRESKRIGEKFASLLRETLACLKDQENIDVNELVMFISSLQKFQFLSKPHYEKVQSQLQLAKEKSEVMKLLETHVSWFNHSLIGSLVHEFKLEAAIRSYEDYIKNHLNPFLKKSLFEIPKKSSDSFQGSGQFVLKLSIPSPTETLSANVIIDLKDQVASALCVSIDALEFCNYDRGCFELTFSAPHVLLKEMIYNNDRLVLVLQNVSNIVPGMKIQAIKFDGDSQLIEPLEGTSMVSPATDAKMTKIDRMFASLLVRLLRSLASKVIGLDSLKEFICQLMPQRQGFKKLVNESPMFDVDTVEAISSIRNLLMFMKEYWSFFNFSLLKKLIDKFGDEDAKDYLKIYATFLQELSVQEIPILLHHRSSIAGFSSDTLTVTTKANLLNCTVEDLLSVRDSVARILRIENFALILLRINNTNEQLEFLIANQVTVKVGPLEFSSVNEVKITSLKYQGIEQNEETKFSESEDDENHEGPSDYDDSGLETATCTSEYEQEIQPQAISLPLSNIVAESILPDNEDYPKDELGLIPALPMKEQFDTGTQDDTDKIEISTHAETSETKTFLLTRTGINIEESESQPIEDKNESDSEQEWPLLHEEKTLSTSPITSQLNVTAKSFVPEIQKGVHKVCKICLNSSDDESLLINKCQNLVTHSPVQLTCVAQDPNSRKLIPIRPRPLRNIKGDFQLCDMKRCKGDHCTHAHSKLECNAWNCDLKKEMKQSYSTEDTVISSSAKASSVATNFVPTITTKDYFPVDNAPAKTHTQLGGLKFDERGKWKVNFEKRIKIAIDDGQVAQELTTNNYRDKFYHLLCFEESAHIQTLNDKCDGEYRIQCCRKFERESQYLCRMLGMNDDQVQYATQASEGIVFVDVKNQKDICKGTIHHSNFRDLSEHFFVFLAMDDFRLLQKTNPHIGSGWYSVHVEFEVKHSYFNSLHQAVISIPDSMVKKITLSNNDVFIYPSTTSLTVDPKCSDADDLSVDNTMQLEALKTIIKSPVDYPVVVSGPFGSGKTRIIARAAYEFIIAGLRSKTQTRILLCAHHTNTVETYMLKYLCPAFHRKPQVTIIRITRKDSSNLAHNVITRTIFDFRRNVADGQYINDPVLVIITTYTSSLQVAKILNKVRFTHILLDEAAQVREPEAIAPLSLGDANTKVVVAGDSKQVGPSVLVLGLESRKHGLRVSLLERLERKYKELKGDEYLKYLATNYRCCPQIVEFLSNTIYKYPISCAHEARSEKQHPAIRYPLVFYWCDCNYASAPSNDLKGLMDFVGDAVLQQAQHYFSKWPREWGDVRQRDVCIMSPFRTQLNIIESKLKKAKLGHLTLLPSYLIQGHEFQAVILCTFEPLEKDGTSSNPTKSLTNPKIFNTAISRSKSFVVAVGDPFSLLKAEKQFPENCWRQYLRVCLENNSIFFPDFYTAKKREKSKKKLEAELVGSPEKSQSAEYSCDQPSSNYPFTTSISH